MDVASLARFLNKHPWLMLGTGAAVAGLGALRIRSDRRNKRKAKTQRKSEKEPTGIISRVPPATTADEPPRRRLAFTRRK